MALMSGRNVSLRFSCCGGARDGGSGSPVRADLPSRPPGDPEKERASDVSQQNRISGVTRAQSLSVALACAATRWPAAGDLDAGQDYVLLVLGRGTGDVTALGPCAGPEADRMRRELVADAPADVVVLVARLRGPGEPPDENGGSG